MYFTPVSELYTLFLSLVSVFLPLSSLWAASSLDAKSAPIANIKLNLDNKKQHPIFANAKILGDKIKDRFHSQDSHGKASASTFDSHGNTSTSMMSASGFTDVETAVGMDDSVAKAGSEPRETLIARMSRGV